MGTDELVFDSEVAINVLLKAKEIDLERVCNHCERHVRKDIGIQNAVSVLVQADAHQLTKLREHAFRFVTLHFDRIRTEAKPSLKLLLQNAELMLEVMEGLHVAR